MVFIIIPKSYHLYTLHTSLNNWDPIKMTNNYFETNDYFFFNFNTQKIYYILKLENYTIIPDYFIKLVDGIIYNYVEEINNISFNNIVKVNNGEYLKITENNAIIFEGNLNGKGIMSKDGKIVYDGYFRNGLKFGFGIYYINGKKIYEGDFCNGLYHGNGIFYFKNKKFYQGEFQNNKFHGQGKKFFNGKKTFQGEFQNDLLHGDAKQYINQKLFYKGEFTNNTYSGQGKFYPSSTDSQYQTVASYPPPIMPN